MLNGERSADSKNIEAVKVASRNFEMGWVHDVYIFASRMCYIMHVGAMSVEQGMYVHRRKDGPGQDMLQVKLLGESDIGFQNRISLMSKRGNSRAWSGRAR
jgi:hypothetical protein